MPDNASNEDKKAEAEVKIFNSQCEVVSKLHTTKKINLATLHQVACRNFLMMVQEHICKRAQRVS